MRSVVLVSALAAFAVAAPAPQQIDFAEIEDAPDPVFSGPGDSSVATRIAYDPVAAKKSATAEVFADPLTKRESVEKRGANDPCGKQPDGYGPKPPVDTAADFLAFTVFAETSAQAHEPQGYASSFTDLKGSTHAPNYLGLTTLKTYDTIQCARLCDDKVGCSGFNIYFERDPTLNPAEGCPNPKGFTNIKCTLWGTGVSPQTATNTGEHRGPADDSGEKFHVVITGSNGYNKNAPPPAIAGYSGPIGAGGAINAPSANGVNTFMGAKYFNQPYDTSVCAAACAAQTAYNSRHPTNGQYKVCKFFNAYILSKNNVPEGLYCAMYTQPWDRKYGTNQGQYRGSDYYSVSSSYLYTLQETPSGPSPTSPSPTP
ncbi:MAG: hypothetical protein M1837_001928 [Sclerophora amabilis]|nr:MAG: hypothetical protein M1837_001928 [Sclerophora amabilis]